MTPLLLVAFALAADPTAYRDPPLTDTQRKHWAFVPPTRSVLPTVKDPSRIRSPIDAFIQARLEAQNIAPAADADKLTLIRRVTFDLIGLPPTPAEVDAFVEDNSPKAFEKLVDRLLASPHYGERWAQHWLDVVRFAESNGYELDAERPQAWRYRDYVVRSWNADKPYDQFLREQVAGDLLAAGHDPRKVPDLWHATGLHRCGPVHVVSGNVDKDENRQEVLTEMVNGLSAAVLGLTVGCARCHDHKFDPISLGDYYRLQAFFAGTYFKDVDLATAAEKEALQRDLLRVTVKLAPIKKQIADFDAPFRAKVLEAKKAALDPATREAFTVDAKKRTEAQKKLVTAAGPSIKILWDEVLAAMPPADRAKRDAMKTEQHRIELELPKLPPQAWAIADEKSIPATHVLKRGSVRSKWTEVTAAVPRIAANDEQPKTRLDLANWLVAPKHPLTARVIVNRLWQHHFGRGIVASPNDFGTRGDRPTHPELLDWLARELIEPTEPGATPWSLKRMHKLMVCSTTYQQVSRVATTPAADPDNKLLWKMPRLRLDAEAVRDAILTASGTLTRTVGGPSVKVPLEPEVYDLIFTEDEPSGLWPVTPDVREHTRRSLYLFAKRNVRQPILEALDQPDTLNSCAARPVSTYAPQALILMNGPFSREQSVAFASSVLTTTKDEPKEWVKVIFRRALSREPTSAESSAAVEFLTRQETHLKVRLAAKESIGLPVKLLAEHDPARIRAVADFCLVVLNLAEFTDRP